MTYNSQPDTYAHIQVVQRLLDVVVYDLLRRSEEHDQSKLASPELEAFDENTPKLRDAPYGTPQYRSVLRNMKPALDHHYAHNTHHPEHYENGIKGMSLPDLIEMLCDWKAAGQRPGGLNDLAKSIEVNQERFGYGDELRCILLNTVTLLMGRDANK